ncbi:tripartite ATP-independent transporter DctM subunit [Rhodopseudomonas julia]|uniref:TRAP transporter large permease protein n=1 Tax=Rhodopseudomonas julia TaxID=200617 RepID=A0ABU0C1M6_9BRAD|nr:TRAP transporter large permease [Rhodopseudomonas julia]MDQ0324419.1 tripartite ATP-independent transporter DctM subunit [Rhodopseudomonas julia]
MSDVALGGWSFAVLLLLIFLRMPIGLAMLLVGLVGNALVNGSWTPLLAQLKSLTYESFSSYSLSIVPLFLLMGQFATRGGMSRQLFDAAAVLLGHRKGGVAMAAVGACAGFGAICGSSLATAATMAKVAIPEMRRFGYSGALSTGCLAAGGTLGILIPPSVILVIYAILTEQNIAKLFLAAVLPGLLAALGYMLAIAIYVRLWPDAAGRRDKADREERLAALIAVWPVLAVFVAVIGGIYLGIFTPTEGAAVGALGTGLIALATGALGPRALIDALLETAVATAMIFFIVFGAAVFNTFLAFSQLPQELAQSVMEAGLDPWTVLAAILLCYLAFGCVMDSLSMILLTIPIFFPLVSGLDFGLGPEEFAIWFGILVLIVVEVGLITPPVGMNLFVINSLSEDVPMSATFRGVIPFVASDILRITILVAFPSITLVMLRILY